MATNRIFVSRSGPSVDFWLDADWGAQDYGANWSRLDINLISRTGGGGSSGSYANGFGKQTAHANGYVFEHNGNPFLPSGYPPGALRWSDWGSKWFTHDGNGYLYDVSLAMELQYTGVNGIWYGSIGAPGRIPKPPAAVTNLRVEDITPTNAHVRYGGVSDDRGAGVQGYLVRYYEIDYVSNPVIWEDTGSNGDSYPSGVGLQLKPATRYDVYVYARNSQGYGDAAGVSFTTLSGAYVSDGNSWRPAPVYESDGSNWQNRVVQVSNGTAWQQAQ